MTPTARAHRIYDKRPRGGHTKKACARDYHFDLAPSSGAESDSRANSGVTFLESVKNDCGYFLESGAKAPTKDELEQEVKAALPQDWMWSRVKNWRVGPRTVLGAYELSAMNPRGYGNENSLALKFTGSEADLMMLRLAAPEVDYAIFDSGEFGLWAQMLDQVCSLLTSVPKPADNVKSLIATHSYFCDWGNIPKGAILIPQEEAALEAEIATLRQRALQRWKSEIAKVIATARKHREGCGRLILSLGVAVTE